MTRLAWAFCALAACLGLTVAPPQSPEAVVIFTGDIRGYLSPCGCADPMIGGVERMAGVVRQLKRQPNAIYVDLGNWLEGFDRQEQLKAEALAQTWRTLEPAYLNVSSRDVLLDDGYLSALRGIVGGAIDSAEVKSAALPGEAFVEKYGVTISGVASASASVLEALPSKPKVVLISGSLETAKAAAEKGGAGLYVYSLQGDPHSEPIVVGDSSFVTVGDHCRYVGKIELVDGTWTNFRLIELGPEHAGDQQAIDAYRAYLRRVTEENLLAGVPRGKGGAAFVGSDTCMPCHQDDYKTWKNSLHADAYKTLQKTGNDRDPECVGCHVVGLEHETGFNSVEKQPSMAAVGCESCHGAGSKHIESPYEAYRAGGENSCLPCHEPKHSPNFSYAEYWKKIEHGQGYAKAAELAEALRAAEGKSQGALFSELGDLGEYAIGELRTMLLGDNRGLSFWALQELVDIRSPRVLPVLIERQKTAEEKELSSSILLAIGNHGNPRAFGVLKPYLGSRLASVRHSAAYAMGGIGDPAAIPLLENLLKDADAGVRWQARESIKNIRSIVRKYPDRLTKKQWWN